MTIKKLANRTLRELFFVLGLLPAAIAHAGTYYVAVDGSDSHTCGQAQNQSTPRRTLNAGIGCLSSGDTLEVKAGTYTRPSVLPPSGSSWSNLTTIKRFGSDTVTLTFPKEGRNSEINFNQGVSYVALEGFILDGGFNTALIIGLGDSPHHIKIANNVIKNSTNMGIEGTCVGCWITSNQFHALGHSCPYITLPDGSPAPCPTKEFNVGYSAGIYIGDQDVLIENNEFWDFAGSAIQVFNSGARPTDNTIVRYNRIHDGSGSWAVRGDGLNGSWGIILANGSNLQAYGNIITNLRGVASGPTVSNSPYGILVMSTCSDCTVYNNTVYNNPALPAVVVHASGTTIINNIFWNNAGVIDDQATGVTYFASNNLCNTAAPGCSVTSDPLFVNAAGDNSALALEQLEQAGDEVDALQIIMGHLIAFKAIEQTMDLKPPSFIALIEAVEKVFVAIQIAGDIKAQQHN